MQCIRSAYFYQNIFFIVVTGCRTVFCGKNIVKYFYSCGVAYLLALIRFSNKNCITRKLKLRKKQICVFLIIRKLIIIVRYL